MRLNYLDDVARMTGPFVSVCIDAGRAAESGAQRVEQRWQARRRELADAGVPDATLRAMEEPALMAPEFGGPAANLVVATEDEVVLAMSLPGAPPRDESLVGPAPQLLPALRSADATPVHVLVDVDRTGADITVVGPLGDSRTTEVTGEHDVIHKVPAGLSERRIQARVQDSWDRNAASVAAQLDAVAAQVRPDLVITAGDPYAMAAFIRAVGKSTAQRVVRMDTGGRAGGISQAARDRGITRVLDDWRARARQDVLSRFSAAEARQQEAVQSLAAVVDAVRRSQVETLLLHDDPLSPRTVWSGPEPSQIGMTAAEVAALGVDDPQRTRADAAVIRGVLAADGDVTLLASEDPAPTDGIGALLRWSDRSTPHDAVPGMPGRGGHPGPPGEKLVEQTT